MSPSPVPAPPTIDAYDAWMPPADPGYGPANGPHGTVYGGAYGAPTSATPDAPWENTGSLTGHVLAMGMPESIAPTEQRSRARRTVIVVAAGLGLIVLLGAVVAVLASSFLAE
jgi:hypothetical protein